MIAELDISHAIEAGKVLSGLFYANSQLAAENGLESVAFLAISTGVYRFPPERAAEIAVGTVADFLAADGRLETVILFCFGEGPRGGDAGARLDQVPSDPRLVAAWKAAIA